MDTQEAVNWMVTEDNSREPLDDALLKLSSSLILRLADMDLSLAEDGQAEDDQTKDMVEDSPEVEGSDGSESETDGRSGHDEAASSGDGITGVDSSVKDVCEVSVKADHVPMRERRAANLQRDVLKTIRDSLFDDPYIIGTAETYGFPEGKRITMGEKKEGRCLIFYVKAAFFEDWLKRHSDCIGTSFTLRAKPHPYSTNQKYEVKGRIKGGRNEKTRLRLPSISCNCRSFIKATFRPRSTSDGTPGNTYMIEYFFEHNHRLGCAENIGMLKSEAIKLRIKAMLMRGMSIDAIMEQLTMDHARFARLLEGKETMALSRDNFITYDDVYNILYAITAKEETGFGIPVAFLLTKTQKWELLKEWLCQLKAKMDQLCTEPYFPTAVRKQLKGILYAQTEEESNTLLDAFRNEWQDTASKFLEYLDDNYLAHEADRRRWMFCHRQQVAYGCINTNNFIESWHNTLKKHFFKDNQQRRLDSVIHTLAKKAVPHFQQMRVRHIVQVGKMAPGRKKALIARLAAQDHIDRTRVQDPGKLLLLQSDDDSVLKVPSFTTPDVSYDLKVDWDLGMAGQFRRCTCADFSSTHMACKHLALAEIAFPNTDYRPKGHLEFRADPMPLSSEEDLSLQPAPTVLTVAQTLSSIVDSINSYISVMDPTKDVPNNDEVLSTMKRARDLLHAHIPVKEGYSLSNKRQRQRPK
ncbi:hypothetical protein BGX30_010964 [Mortierella sp. GBA39]|nr:hypothetical protein BGX30_010964 [Mortierella sp. GBA39]